MDKNETSITVQRFRSCLNSTSKISPDYDRPNMIIVVYNSLTCNNQNSTSL